MDIKKALCAVIFLLSFFHAHVKSQSALQTGENTWHKIYNTAISDDGRWTFLVRNYDDGKSQGVLQQTETMQTFIIESSGKYALDNHYFMTLNSKKELFLKNLNSGTEKIFNEVSDFDYDATSATILYRNGTSVRLLDLRTNKEISLVGIGKMQNVPNTPCTLLSKEGDLLLLNRDTHTEPRVLNKNCILLDAIADPEKQYIKLFYHNQAGYWLQTIDFFGKNRSSPKKMNFGSSVGSLSFLSVKTLMEKKPLSPSTGKKDDTVVVWSNSDRALKPRLMNMTSAAQNITLYDITGKTSSPKTYKNFKTEPYLIFDDNYLLELSVLENYDYKINDLSPRPKIILRNRETNEIEMELQQVTNVYPSAKLGYLLYFKGRDWYHYNLSTRETVNITADLKADFYTVDRLNTEVLFPVDSPRFSPDYRSIYFTSKNDIWKYDVTKKHIVKLTNGNDNISFRIVSELKGAGVSTMKWHNNPVINNNFLVFKMSDPKFEIKNGLALWRDNRLRIISPTAIQSISYLREGKHALSYVIQNANLPPQLIAYRFKTNAQKRGYDSGKDAYSPSFPKTVLREWTDSKGQKTYTTIVLPPDYKPEKKYPAIVRIYENEAKRYTEFEFPTYHNSTGFNRTLMAMNGYIVILPRITYVRNQVGQSALQSVEETLKKVESWYGIDRENIGIIGHSFGGYETNYILTQSSLFKTAVSGSSIADIISDYFTVHKMYRNSNISRYTNEQFGFSDGFFALKKDYLANNPILMADQIKTSLLLWSGNKDEHVEWRQSVEMFMALASLKKEVHLLLFPDDIHVLVKKPNQIEATKRILQWFDYYLKNGSKPEWF